MLQQSFLYLFSFFLCFCLSQPQKNWAQKNKVSSKNSKSSHDSKFNSHDQQGLRDGIWYFEHPSSVTDGHTLLIGHYVAGRKQGLWYTTDQLGRLLSIQNYKDDALNGTSQFYDQGRLICIGNYRGLDPNKKMDTVAVYDPITGEASMVEVPTDIGSFKHGIWRYYNPNTGQLIREEFYQVGDLLSRKQFKPSSAINDSIPRQQTPAHPPIDIKRATQKIPKHAKQRIGY